MTDQTAAPSRAARADDVASPDGDHRRGRVLLIGLDAAAADIIMRGIDDGDLPTFQRLRTEGAWGLVSSPRGFGSGAVWPSFATGVSPAKHGRYYYRQVGPGSYAAERFEPEQFGAEPAWEYIARHDRSIAVFDVPKTGLPTEPIRGFVAVDWISHGPVYSQMRTWPTEFADELTTKFGANPLWKCDMPGGRDADQLAQFCSQMRDRVGQRERATRHYWAAGHDLLMTVFAEPHCVGHQGWHVRDREHPMHDAEAYARVGDPVVDIYREIDAAIGRILADVDSDTTVIVFSGTGMGPNYTGNHMLDDLLRAIDQQRPTRLAALTTSAKQLLKRILPPDVRRRGQAVKRRVEEQAFSGDRARRKSFMVPHNDIAGAIRLNIVGREPAGILEPHQVDAYVDRLRTELLALRNADTGNPIVEAVVRVADEHAGPWIDHMPDLLVVWNRHEPIDRVTSDTIGSLESRNRRSRTGDHSPDNLFFAIGPNVRPGHTEGVELYDFAPTLCDLLGVPTMTSDGDVISALTERALAPEGADRATNR